MCLSEIQYMQSLLTLPRAQTFKCDMLVSHPTEAEPARPIEYTTVVITIPSGKYTSAELLEQMILKCPESLGHPCYQVGFVSANDRRVEFKFPGLLGNIEITKESELLFSMLGFTNGEFFMEKKLGNLG